MIGRFIFIVISLISTCCLENECVAQTQPAPVGHGCIDGTMKDIGFKMTIVTALGNSIEVKDPAGQIKDYLADWAKGDKDSAQTKADTFLGKLKEAAATGKKFGKYLSIGAEFLSSAGLIVDAVKMDVDFKCCKLGQWVARSSSGSAENLFISLKNADEVKEALPQAIVDAMVDAAGNMAGDCASDG